MKCAWKCVKITRWERGYRLILDRVDFSVHKKEKVLIRGKIQEDTRQMFQVAYWSNSSAGRNIQNINVRVSYRSNFRIWSG